MNELDQMIAEAQAAKVEVDAWDRKRALAAQLPQLLAERDRQDALDDRRHALAAALQNARQTLSGAAVITQDWRRRVLELAGQLDGATRETAPALRDALDRHVDNLLTLQAPILQARAEVQRLAGGDFDSLWAEVGGYNPALDPTFGKELGHLHREGIKRRLRGRAIYLPQPMGQAGGPALPLEG